MSTTQQQQQQAEEPQQPEPQQPEEPQAEEQQADGTAIVKRNAIDVLRAATAPKIDTRGKPFKSVIVDSLSLGDGVTVSGKLTLEHQDSESDTVRALLDGSGANVLLKFMPSSKGRLWSSEEGGFYKGGFTAEGLSGNACVIIQEKKSAYVGQAHAGIGCGRGVLHSANGSCYSGKVVDTMPNGTGVLRTGSYTLKGLFKDGQPTGRISACNLDDGSTYTTSYVDGMEVLCKRSSKKRRSDTLAEYDDAAEVSRTRTQRAARTRSAPHAHAARRTHTQRAARAARTRSAPHAPIAVLDTYAA